MAKKCSICGRREGTLLNRDQFTRSPPPLGPIERCDVCGRMACPDCRCEADCCFVEEDAHDKERGWAPVGWRVESDDGTFITYVRKRGKPCNA